MISSKSLTELFRYINCFIFAVVMIFPIIFSKAASYQTRVRGMRMSSAVESIRISTYNVLSSSLGGQDYYVACNPDWLSPKHRLKKLKEKLEPEIEKNSIICLVSFFSFSKYNIQKWFSRGTSSARVIDFMDWFTTFPLFEERILFGNVIIW